MRSFYRTLLIVITLALVACGDGSNGSAPSTTVARKLVTSGTLTRNLSGVSVTVPLPPGVTIAVDGAGNVVSSAIVVSGVTAAAASIPDGTISYTAPNGTTPGTVSFILVSSVQSGFGVGEFATMTFTVTAGASVPQGVIAGSNFEPIDLLGSQVTGLTATLQ